MANIVRNIVLRVVLKEFQKKQEATNMFKRNFENIWKNFGKIKKKKIIIF